MLSRPQENGSCKSCRDNRLHCDRQKPRCGQCTASNKKCGGYDWGKIFINMNSDGPPPVWNRSQHAQKYLVLDVASQSAATGGYPIASTAPATLSYPSIETLAASMTAARPSLSMYSTAGTDPSELSRTTELFLDLYYKRNIATSNQLVQGNEHSGWRVLLPRWIGQSPILDVAIGALAASFIGMQYQDHALVDRGSNMYLKALQMVQQALPQSGPGRWDLLATTLVMSSTEVFLGNGGGPSQLTHIEGATRLLHSSIGSINFDELHTYVLTQCLWDNLAKRRHCFFSQQENRSLVRQIYSAPRTSGNHLLFQWCEVITPLPNILHAIDSLAASNATVGATSSSHPPNFSSASAAIAILNDIVTVERTVAPWSDLLKATVQGPWTVPATQVSADTVPFPLHFVSVEACALFCLHWSSQLLLLEARQMIYRHLPPSHIPKHPAAHALLPQMTEYASLICRSVQFCTQGASYAAAENMFLPLFIAASYYMRQGDEDRKNWCVGAFSRIAVEQKIGFAAEMLDFVEQRVVFR